MRYKNLTLDQYFFLSEYRYSDYHGYVKENWHNEISDEDQGLLDIFNDSNEDNGIYHPELTFI